MDLPLFLFNKASNISTCFTSNILISQPTKLPIILEKFTMTSILSNSQILSSLFSLVILAQATWPFP